MAAKNAPPNQGFIHDPEGSRQECRLWRGSNKRKKYYLWVRTFFPHLLFQTCLIVLYFDGFIFFSIVVKIALSPNARFRA